LRTRPFVSRQAIKRTATEQFGHKPTLTCDFFQKVMCGAARWQTGF
jgi:hypothetical protein